MRLATTAILLFAAACSKADAPTDKIESKAEPAAAAAAPSASAPDLWPEGFPTNAADYSGVYAVGVGGRMVDATIMGSGANQRVTFPPGAGFGAGAWSQVLLTDTSGGKMLMWPEGEGAPKIAATMSRSDLGALAVSFGASEDLKTRAKKTGEDEIAGEKCAIYEVTTTDGETPASACVTRDGVPLRMVTGGQTVMLAKSITRGKQDPSLFAAPAGYEIADMGECLRISAEAMAAMQKGKTPDLAKMAKCQALGEKMGAMFGGR